MNRHQRGFTIMEIMIGLTLFGILFSMFVPMTLSLRDYFQVRALESQALNLVRYVDHLRQFSVSTTPADIFTPGGVFQQVTLTAPAGTTIPALKSMVQSQLGFTPEDLPEQSPWDTPYTVSITRQQATVTVTVPVTDLKIDHAATLTNGNETTFTFFPVPNREHGGIGRTAGARMARGFLKEDLQ